MQARIPTIRTGSILRNQACSRRAPGLKTLILKDTAFISSKSRFNPCRLLSYQHAKCRGTNRQTDRQVAFQLYIVHNSIQKQRTTAKELCMAHRFIQVLVQAHKSVFTSLVCLYQEQTSCSKNGF